MAQNLPVEYARALKANIPLYLKGAADATIKSQVILSELKRRGRIVQEPGGTSICWDVKKGDLSLQTVTDGGTISVSRSNRYDQAQLGWFAYVVTDAFTRKEELMNADSPQRLVNYVGKMFADISEDMKKGLNAELYKDGEATANANRIHGLETLFQINTATVPTGGAARILLETAHGTLTYANIRLDAVYNSNYYWMPLMIPDTGTGGAWANFQTSGDTETLLNYAILKHQERNNKIPDIGITTFAWFAYILDYLQSKANIYIPPSGLAKKDPDAGVVRNYVPWGGVDIYPESDMPTPSKGGANGLYFLNLDELTYHHLGEFYQDASEGLDLEEGMIKKIGVAHFGQLTCKTPRNQTKIVDRA